MGGNANGASGRRRDWRIWFGMTTTLVWLALGFNYIVTVIGWDRFATQPAEALGAFLEGAFAPLAFLWLVIGFFLQQRELGEHTEAIRQQYEAMRRTAEQAEVQARAIAASELHAHQETFLKIADLVFRQLGGVLGFLWMSSQATDGQVTPDDIAERWSRLGVGDYEVFGRQLMQLHFMLAARGESSYDLFYGTEIRRRHCETVIHTFERLLRNARGCDPEGVITDALIETPPGRLYKLMLEYREQPPAGVPA